MTALLPTPGTGVCKPGAAHRRDTDKRRRQVTKLPKPIPQYLPFTLRYGFCSASRVYGAAKRRTAMPFSLVPLMLSV